MRPSKIGTCLRFTESRLPASVVIPICGGRWTADRLQCPKSSMRFRFSTLALLVNLLSGHGLVACATDGNNTTTGPSATVADTDACDGITSCSTEAPEATTSSTDSSPPAGSNPTAGPSAQATTAGPNSVAPSSSGGTPTSGGGASATSDPVPGLGGVPGVAGGGAGEGASGNGASTNGGAGGSNTAQGGDNAGGAATQGGASGAGAPSTGGSAGQASAPGRDARRMLLRDEGISQLSYVNLAAPAENWHVTVPVGRDMQLVGAGRVMIGTETATRSARSATALKSTH
jgi:hypothetical protein